MKEANGRTFRFETSHDTIYIIDFDTVVSKDCVIRGRRNKGNVTLSICASAFAAPVPLISDLEPSAVLVPICANKPHD